MDFVPDLLSYASVQTPDHAAVVTADKRLTFRELDTRANRVVRLFRDFSLEAGDVVALLAKNEAEYFELHVAAIRAGVVLLPLNFRLALPELEYIINDSKPKLLICGEEFSETARALPVSRQYILGGDYESMIASVEPVKDKHWSISANAPFVILYTSGTTGRPKGTIISNRALFARISCNLFEYQLTPEDRFLMCLQLFHIGSINCLSHLYVGSTIVLIKDFDAAAVLELLPRHRITVALLVPTMINTIINLPGVENADFSSLRTVVYGGSPIPPVTLARAVDLMSCGFLQTYGMTETNAITFLRPRDHDPVNKPHLLASAGTPGLGMEARVVDEQDRDVGTGELGEIVCRGPLLMDKYLNMPAATEEALRGGWMHTGDVGYFDVDGYLYVTDRKKDMIVTGGENVYPREVEDVLFEHPDILEAAVIGVPDDKWGERVHAVLVFRSGIEPDKDSVIAFTRARLAGYKLPKTVEIVAELPKNAAGKVAKNELRDAWVDKQ
jgi:acyl-CoA synthetase (AMP-forming)/AMP-acid ligase II